MKTARYLGLMEIARETGIPYWRIIYAEQAGYLPGPMQIACKRVYTEEDVERIRNYFLQNTKLTASTT
jgi:DNA-binding transcriptional MerR regulator